MAKRVLCVRIPSFALAVVARAGAPEGPWVVLDGAGPRSRVAEVSGAAVEEGVRAGMSLPQARASSCARGYRVILVCTQHA